MPGRYEDNPELVNKIFDNLGYYRRLVRKGRGPKRRRRLKRTTWKKGMSAIERLLADLEHLLILYHDR